MWDLSLAKFSRVGFTVTADLGADSSSPSFEALLLIKSTLISTHVVKRVI